MRPSEPTLRVRRIATSGLLALATVASLGCATPGGRHAVADSLAAARPLVRDDVPAWLQAGDYARADARLRDLQAHYEGDPAAEVDLDQALLPIVNSPDIDLEERYAEWLRRYPDSFAAELGTGAYYEGRAWRARGSAPREHTSAERFAEMRRHLAVARVHLERAITLNPRAVSAYALLIDAAKAVSERERARYLTEEALRIAPDNLLVRRIYFSALTPRWGGSIEAMQHFLDETVPHMAANPKLRFLRGRVTFEQAEMLCTFTDEPPRCQDALAHYDEALSQGRDYPYLLGRGNAYLLLGRYADAARDFEEGISKNPTNRDLHAGLVAAKARGAGRPPSKEGPRAP
jgi:tetratricopeptide (TPR) repeat protein